MNRRLIALFAALALSISFLPASLATDVEDQMVLEMKQHGDGGWIGMTFENAIDDYLPSHIYADNGKANNSTNEGLDTIICTSTKDAACLKDGYGFDFRAVLPPCVSADQLDCIQSITAKLADGSISEGTVVRKWNTAYAYPGDSALGIPEGGPQTTWKIPGSNPGGSEEYALTAIINGRTNLRINGELTRFAGGGFQVNFKPIREVTGDYREPTHSIGDRGLGKGVFQNTVSNDKGCVIAEAGRCALAASFDLNTQFTLKVRLSTQSAKWLHGRLYDPAVTVDEIAGGGNLLTVSANPLQVPMVAGWVRWQNLPAAIQAKYPQGAGGTGGNYSDFTTSDLANRILRVGMRAAGQEALEDFRLWNPLLADRPMAMRTIWSIRSISNFDPAIQSCNRQGLSGLVTTNAAVYSDGPPSFDKESQSLNYTVGAPHYDTDNKVFNGTYSLIMNAEVARCIYGFGSAPISAKIEIASEDGTPSIAVTTLNQKDGWLRLSANGFHYSTPKISVKLTEEKPVVVAAPSPTPAVAAPLTSGQAAVKLLKTIKCVKGKLVKKMTAITPSCPKGYKKA
jgi:hypothetical protein